MESEQKERSETEKDEREMVDKWAKGHPGVTACTCDCQLRVGNNGSKIPPVWHEREFPGQVVREQEAACVNEVCPRLWRQCVKHVCTNQLRCHPQHGIEECGGDAPIASCAFVPVPTPKAGALRCQALLMAKLALVAQALLRAATA